MILNFNKSDDIVHTSYIYILFSILVCEQAYSMAQNLDPNSDGRGVLQFKTGLMSVIKVSIKNKILWHIFIKLGFY